VKVLLDECVDRRFARHLAGHAVKTARQMGWTTI
jgi:predicted GNAT family acetyltransferase